MTDTVSFVVPEPATDDRLNEPVARAGSPLTLKLTFAENDPTVVTVTVYVILAFPLTVWLLGEAAIEKSPIESVTCAVCTRLPLVAVIVSG